MGNRAFKDHHGHYLSAEGDALHTSHHLDHHSHFHIEKHGDKVALKTHHGRYVTVDNHHHVHLAHHIHQHDSLFHLEHHHGKVAIKGHHGHYIGSDHGRIRTHHAAGPSEHFEEIHV
eukprot:TRINITY_DN460_c0_g1_i2.p1 TRINITY_DN460_c0_g1~~TRINITY_DN460_c0_g1_i2.p1  ORF type:complete len:136 (-),score=39.33 TRINITY_DN460_c0_g1_i2:104-454(-)